MTQTPFNFTAGMGRVCRLAEQIVQSLPMAAGRLLRQDATIASGTPVEKTVGEFLQALPEPTCCYSVVASQDGQIHGAGYVEVSPELALGVIDLLLSGATAGTATPKRPLTSIDRQVLRRFVEQICGCLGPDSPDGDGPRIQLAVPNSKSPLPLPGQSALCLTFEMRIGACRGEIHLALTGEAVGWLTPDDSAQPAPGEAELSVIIEEDLGSQELAPLGAGDILVTDLAADGEVLVRVDGVAKFAGRLGQHNGHRAVTITRKLD